MKKSNLTKQLIITIGFASLMLIATGCFGYFIASSFLKKSASATAVTQAHKALLNVHANVLTAMVYKAENNTSGLAALGQVNRSNLGEFKKYIENLNSFSFASATKGHVADVLAGLNQLGTESNDLIAKLLDEKTAADGRASFSNFEKTFKSFDDKVTIMAASIDKDTTNAFFNSDKAPFYMLCMLFLCLATFGSFGLFMVRKIGNDFKSFFRGLHESANQVKHSAQKLSSSNVQLSSNATETASSLEETVASLEELSSMISLNTENSSKVFSVSESTAKVAEAGELNIRSLNSAMNEIKSDSKKMEDIVNVIDDISFQTNLLALNAAVEAARAGEQGKGFAVVADAVRSLALRSSTSAKEISDMIKENLSKVDRGSLLAGQCNESLKQIVMQVKNVTELSGQIATASQEQTSGLKQINQAMIQLDSASQDNATAAESVSLAATAAQEESGKMLSVVFNMQEFIFGANGFSETVELSPKAKIQNAKIQNAKQTVVKVLHKVSTKSPTKASGARAESKLKVNNPAAASSVSAAVTATAKSAALKADVRLGVKPTNVVQLKAKKSGLNMGQAPTDNKIKKIENF